MQRTAHGRLGMSAAERRAFLEEVYRKSSLLKCLTRPDALVLGRQVCVFSAHVPSTEKEVSEFKCHNDFVKIADHDWKAAYCVREYKKFPKLHDAFLSFAILDQPKSGYIIRIGLAGLNEILARRFLQKFLGAIKWTD